MNWIGKLNIEGNLTVIGVTKVKGKSILEVTCNECCKDPELFPKTFLIRSDHFNNGVMPCGCSKNYGWTEEQYLILARKAGEGRFIVHGFAEEFKNQNSKLKLECIKDGHEWEASIHNIINGNRGCPFCAGTITLTEDSANIECIKLCSQYNYKFLGFVEGYKNNKSKLKYTCPRHGEKIITYYNFQSGRKCPCCSKDNTLKKITASKESTINKILSVSPKHIEFICFTKQYKSANSARFYCDCQYHGVFETTYKGYVNKNSNCPLCSNYGYNPNKSGSFYIVEWTNEDHSFIKFGITNRDVNIRIKEQSDATNYKPEFLFVAYFNDGNIPLNIESHIKSSNLNRNIISKELFADGFTETIEIYDLPTLEDLIVESLITTNYKEV